MTTEIDHIVVSCDSLEQGRQWCQDTLGAEPVTGGRHALMGTHNILVNLSSPAFPRCYLEIIAIDPQAPHPGRPRWFGLDRRSGPPTLAGYAVRSTRLAWHRECLLERGIDPGPIISLSRGDLHWQMLVNEQAELPGALPMLLAWGDRHPTDPMPPSGLVLKALEVDGVPEEVSKALGLQGATPQSVGLAALRVHLEGPRGGVALQRGPATPAA